MSSHDYGLLDQADEGMRVCGHLPPQLAPSNAVM